MTKIIIIEDSNLDSYYEKTRGYILEKYHSYPTKLESSKTSDGNSKNNANSRNKNQKSDSPRQRII